MCYTRCGKAYFIVYKGLLIQQGIQNIPCLRVECFMAWSIDNNKCLRCGGCVSVCPTAALELRDKVIYDEEMCTLCGICEKFCPVEAIKVTKK